MEGDRDSSVDRRVKAYGPVLFVLFAFAAYNVTKNRAVVASLIATALVTSVFLVLFLIGNVTMRLCQTLFSIVTHVSQHSGESVWSIVRYHFSLNTASATTVVFGALLFLGLTITIRRCPLSYAWDFGPYICCPLIIFVYCLARMIDLDEWESRLQFDLSFMKGLDYGTGMAYSFYYGYLRLILPSTGTASKSIIEKIENFEDNHNVTFPIHKLFILIPSSGYIPPDLKDASYQWMESARELEEEKRSRAGNIGRVYRNNAYKIYPGGRRSGTEPVYAVVEGASALLTYHEVQKHNHPESVVYKRYKKEIVQIFHKKLYEILQSEPDTRDLCELIYYDDYDSQGTKVNVAEIILKRIAKMKKSA
ncbi:hypothetical protein P5V15_007678 [Pogonomyrmex californicus]